MTNKKCNKVMIKTKDYFIRNGVVYDKQGNEVDKSLLIQDKPKGSTEELYNMP